MILPSRLVSILMCTTLTGGCATRYLPPPAAPPRIAPRVEVAPPPPQVGEGRVTLDTPGGPASAELITQRTQIAGAQAGAWVGHHGHTAYAPSTQYTLRPLCQTPCAVNLPRGAHEILFTSLDPSSDRSSPAYVNVGAAPSIARHAMGRRSSSMGALVGGFVAGGVGAALALFGTLALALDDDRDPRTRGYDAVGWPLLGIGLGLTAGGIVLGQVGRPVEQPGATTQWTLSP